MTKKYTVPFENVGIKDVALVGGKNASLGEMIRELGKKGVRVPSGFIVTANAYQYFLKETGLDKKIKDALYGLDTKNLKQLEAKGKHIREIMKKTDFPYTLKKEIEEGYEIMEKKYGKNVDVAVRSSATAEDLPGASFAGEHETYLGIRGKTELMLSVRAAMASLFTNRAISYRVDKGFAHTSVSLSVGIQKMVRSDKGCSGVMFTLDTESGFKNVVTIDGSWGLGEMIVQGEVTPDEFLVWKEGLKDRMIKPIIDKRLGVKEKKMVYSRVGRGVKQTKIITTSQKEKESFIINNKEILTLAHWGVVIENHYTKKRNKWTPMDMEWAKDGETGELFIVQARPETVHAERDYGKIKEYKLQHKSGTTIVRGASVGSKIAVGSARVILDAKHIHDFKKGEVLVTDMTDPDWEPIMKIASAIVTDKGGRTSHAAIVSRELGIPAIVGTENVTKMIQTGDVITIDTTGSEGLVYKGKSDFKVKETDVKKIPTTRTHVMVNVAMPESAFESSFLPNSGVGLAREEFIIASKIGIHPLALIEYDREDPKIKHAIDKRTRGWEDKIDFYVDNLAFGIGKIGAAFYPNPVIVRFSDFKTNEYCTLLGGSKYEPKEENPMLGWRGASRYYDPKFKSAFKLECYSIKKVRNEMGLTNVIPMVPFCRTVEEGKKTRAIMKECGLLNTPVYVMCEIPSNVLLAEDFLEIFDGMSIGSNDLTQLTLGLDRDSGIVTHIANENDEAVKDLIQKVIRVCKKKKKYIGICGQAPSDYPHFVEFLVREGISSISLNPDTVIGTILNIAKIEKKIN